MKVCEADVSPAIAALINEMPRKPGDPWPLRERQKWLKAFGAVLDVVYPEKRLPAKPAGSDKP